MTWTNLFPWSINNLLCFSVSAVKTLNRSYKWSSCELQLLKFYN